MKVIIDTDPGTDDIIALIMALNSPDLEIVGLTTVGGNATLAQTTRNSLRLLEYMGRTEIPVAKGSARPLRGKFHYAYYHHGPAGLTVRLPLPKTEPIPRPATDFIISAARRLEGELTIIALGPLTNLARSMQEEPRLSNWIREVVVMGGALEVPGNITPHAEFNIYDDPLAANFIFSTGMSVRLIGLDVCNQTYVTRADHHWLSIDTPGGRLAGRILENWFKPRGDDAIYQLCDPLAVAATIKPDLLSYKQANVKVEAENLDRIGQTTATYGEGNVNVAASVNPKNAKAFVRDLLRC